MSVLLGSLILAGGAQGQAPSRQLPRLAAVEAGLHREGPQATLKRFFPCDRDAGTGYAAIASGDPAWVSLAERLLPTADACFAEGIQSALGRAMRARPENVLPLVGKTEALSPEHICLPFVSAEAPLSVQRRQVSRSLQAVEKAHVRGPQRDACMAFIQSVAAGLGTQR